MRCEMPLTRQENNLLPTAIRMKHFSNQDLGLTMGEALDPKLIKWLYPPGIPQSDKMLQEKVKRIKNGERPWKK